MRGVASWGRHSPPHPQEWHPETQRITTLTLILQTTTIFVVCSSAHRFHSRIRVKQGNVHTLKFSDITIDLILHNSYCDFD